MQNLRDLYQKKTEDLEYDKILQKILHNRNQQQKTCN